VQAEILTSISDVTDRVDGAIAGKIGPDFVKSRDATIAAIEQEGCAGKAANLRCQVVTLYQGGQYKLYTYRKYSDVRLVFAPELATAFFGGDPDNFNFPHYALECSSPARSAPAYRGAGAAGDLRMCGTYSRSNTNTSGIVWPAP
jgi:hypothetical protein